jgi:hypothetical protein
MPEEIKVSIRTEATNVFVGTVMWEELVIP